MPPLRLLNLARLPVPPDPGLPVALAEPVPLLGLPRRGLQRNAPCGSGGGSPWEAHGACELGAHLHGHPRGRDPRQVLPDGRAALPLDNLHTTLASAAKKQVVRIAWRVYRECDGIRTPAWCRGRERTHQAVVGLVRDSRPLVLRAIWRISDQGPNRPTSQPSQPL
jgi:hypothetical protein